VRKLLLADTLVAAIPLHIWAEPRSVTVLELWLWLGVYAAYLYNDFAGYTSLVRGVSGLFGIELSPNFNAPVLARTFSEFWNRWHITLSHWLRDYVFYPLSRSLARQVRDRNHWIQLTIPPMATMLASGLWHGFSTHMLLWGGLHGLFLVAEQLPRRWRGVRPPDTWPRWQQALGVGVVGLLVTLAWVTFRLEVPAALEFWQALLTWSGLAIQHRRLFVALALAGCGLAIDWAQVSPRGQLLPLRSPRLVRAGLTGLILFGIWIVIETDVPQPFIYQGF
jgi:D-alanyl-lipoteichoic acid acyltransferase DltB (MBOAT superfamily)